MDKKKYIYKSYDYSFLAPSYKWTNLVNKVYSSTLASYIVPANVMDLTTGELFYFEPSTATYNNYTTNAYSYT